LQCNTQSVPERPEKFGPLHDTNGDHQTLTAQPFETNAPLDFERALKEFEGDEALLIDVLKGFVSNVREQIGIIQQALMTRDAERARREAHSIKGGAANLRADGLSSIAFELENLVKLGKLERGTKTLKKLQDELSKLDNFVGILTKGQRV
jgi:HPt (histidine-containing phosphotransfer) domain-containing protein